MLCCKITEAASTPGVNEKYSETFTDKIPFVLFPESCNTTKGKNDFVLNIHELGRKRKVKSESCRHFCTCHGVKKVNCFSVSVVLRDHVNTLAAGPRWAARDCVAFSMRTSGPWNAKNALVWPSRATGDLCCLRTSGDLCYRQAFVWIRYQSLFLPPEVFSSVTAEATEVTPFI